MARRLPGVDPDDYPSAADLYWMEQDDARRRQLKEEPMSLVPRLNFRCDFCGGEVALQPENYLETDRDGTQHRRTSSKGHAVLKRPSPYCPCTGHLVSMKPVRPHATAPIRKADFKEPA